MGRPSRAKLRAAQPFEIPAELERLMCPLEEVKIFEGNARRGDIEAIKESLRQNGLYRAPVARRETGEILVNNHTMMAAAELGATALPIDWRSIADDDRARAIVLADNRTSDLATYDHGKLGELLEAQAKSAAGLAGTGYDAESFAAVLDRAGASSAPIPEPEPEPPPKRPRTPKGKVIELGPHRLICGDARDRNIVERLLAGATVDMVWTDPPYGVDLGPLAAHRGIDHGDMAGDQPGLEQLAELLTEALSLARENTRAGGACYVCHADTNTETVRAAYRAAGFDQRQVLVWVKNSMVLGRQDYQWRHEPILYGWKPGAHRWYGHRDKTTVIEHPARDALEALHRDDLIEIAWRLIEAEPGTVLHVDRPTRADDHPTVKPVELIAPAIRNSAPAGGIVLDPFAGAGSTLLAAEQEGRAAYLIELDRGYCDVIRRRYQQALEARDQAAAEDPGEPEADPE